MIRHRDLFLIIIAVMIFISGCGTDILEPQYETEDGKVEYLIVANGEISLPLTGFNDLNPLLVDNSDYYHFSKLIFESMFDYDSMLEPVPHLASTYTISEDGKRVEIMLREDIVWHNGDKFDADDVVSTFNALVKAKEEGYLYKLISNTLRGPADLSFMRLKKLTDRSVEVLFKEPLSNWRDLLTFPIVPSSLGTEILKREGYVPVGTGPFKFAEYVKYKEVQLVSNPDYWDGEPSISKISGKIFEDEELILTAFETGKLSMARSIDSDWDKYDHVARIKFYEYVSDEYEIMVFNQNSSVFEGESGNYLKKALMYGIDRQDIIAKVFLEHGTQSDSPVHPQSYLFDSSSERFGYNKERAMSEISRSEMWQMDEVTGKLMDAEKAELLNLKILVSKKNKTRIKIAEEIREDLGEMGIGTEFVEPVRIKEETEEQAFLRYLSSTDYDIALLAYSMSVVPEYSKLLRDVGYMANQPADSEPDKMTLVLNEMYNAWEDNTKISKYHEFQRSFADTLPFGSLFFRNRALMVDSEIKGPLNPNYYNLYEGLEKCFLTFTTD